jgi:hypothetical protein
MNENESFRNEVEAAAEEAFATLHREVALYLETWTIAKARVKPWTPAARP